MARHDCRLRWQQRPAPGAADVISASPCRAGNGDGVASRALMMCRSVLPGAEKWSGHHAAALSHLGLPPLFPRLDEQFRCIPPWFSVSPDSWHQVLLRQPMPALDPLPRNAVFTQPHPFKFQKQVAFSNTAFDYPPVMPGSHITMDGKNQISATSSSMVRRNGKTP